MIAVGAHDSDLLAAVDAEVDAAEYPSYRDLTNKITNYNFKQTLGFHPSGKGFLLQIQGFSESIVGKIRVRSPYGCYTCFAI